jgi:hypothetical protein
MLIGLDILKQVEDIIERAYTDFTYRLVGDDFLTDEQKTQVAALGLIMGRRPLLELLYMLVRQINSPNYQKDKGLNRLLDELALTGVLPTLRDSDKYTVEHAKASVNEAIQLSKNELKKQIKTQILKINDQFKQKQALTQFTTIPQEQEKVEEHSNKMLKGIAYAAVGAAAFSTFRKEFTSAMTNMINSTIVDHITNPLIQTVSEGEETKSEKDPMVYKQVVPDNRLSPECRRLHTHPDFEPRLYRLSTLQANGSNVGRPKSQWLAVIGPTHPNCRCLLRLAGPSNRKKV